MPLKRHLWLFLVLAMLDGAALLSAQKFPSPTGFVNDFAGVMKPEAKQQLEGILADLKQKTSVEVSVVTVKDMGGLDVSTYAVDLMKTWGIGSKEKNEGVLLLMALKERKVRIEVGYGLEPILTDARSGMIRDQYIVPYLKKNDFDTGLSQGALAIVALIAKEKGVELSGAGPVPPPPRETRRRGGGMPFIQLIIFAAVILLLLGRRGGGGCLTGLLLGSMLGGVGSNRHEGFGGFGGGFGGSGFSGGGFGGGGGFSGFGGGFSGGGGASGSF
ncbi:MAG: TPM domain-containing protein [Candidatus Latescibacter sp.]|nr:TPM domain-containing protein [Candidatus Latescibacter sp.]